MNIRRMEFHSTDRPMTRQEEMNAALDRYTTKDAADYFGVTTSTVYNWIKDGCLEAESVTITGKTGRVGRYIIPASEILRIDREGRMILAQTRKWWVRALWRQKQGRKF